MPKMMMIQVALRPTLRTPVSEERVQKVLANAGVASRRACEQLILSGRVQVNGRVVSLGDKCDPENDALTVDGERVHTDPNKQYVMLNKPRGFVTTYDDPQGRPTVMELINVTQRLYPVGRLDQDTEGLLLLTNDGALTHALTHPSFQVERVYVALVPGPVRKQVISELKAGVELEDGFARPKRAQIRGEEKGKALLEIVMTEGRKREVRRLLGAVGLPVERLARVSYGGVELGDLRQGKWRFLTGKEIAMLFAATKLTPTQKPGQGGQ
jgi:23S rRNA pseudouridine2605 synthase